MKTLLALYFYNQFIATRSYLLYPIYNDRGHYFIDLKMNLVSLGTLKG